MSTVKTSRRATPTSPEMDEEKKLSLDERIAPIAPLLVIIIATTFCGVVGVLYAATILQGMSSPFFTGGDVATDLLSAAAWLAPSIMLPVVYRRVKLNQRIKRQIRNCSMSGRRS